jgi:hypothetical protein
LTGAEQRTAGQRCADRQPQRGSNRRSSFHRSTPRLTHNRSRIRGRAALRSAHATLRNPPPPISLYGPVASAATAHPRGSATEGRPRGWRRCWVR